MRLCLLVMKVLVCELCVRKLPVDTKKLQKLNHTVGTCVEMRTVELMKRVRMC